MKKKKIYLAQLEGADYWSIFTSSVQYGYNIESPLFKYENHIMVNRQVTRKEAELLLELIKHNGAGTLCAGPCKSIIELK